MEKINSVQELIEYRKALWERYYAFEITIDEYIAGLIAAPKGLDVMTSEEYREYIFKDDTEITFE